MDRSGSQVIIYEERYMHPRRVYSGMYVDTRTISRKKRSCREGLEFLGTGYGSRRRDGMLYMMQD